MKKEKLLTIIRTIVILILLGIICYCLYQIGDYLLDSYNNNKLNNEMRERVQTGSIEKGKINFDDLKDINSDIVGWITIENTKVHYPVVKTHDNSYYLNRNIKKEYARAGTIFMDYRNEGKGQDKNIILYGHNMKDGSMFKGLVAYKDKKFLMKCPYIQFYTPEEDTKWEIFSVYITDTKFDYTTTDFTSDREYEEFLKEIKSRSLYDTGIEVSKEEQILTLSTCTYEFDDARFVVHAKLIR